MTEQEKQAVETLTRSFTKMETLYKVKCTEVEAREGEISRLKSENAALRERLSKAVELPCKRKRLLWGDKDEETLLCPDCLTDLMGGIGDETFVVQCPNCGCFVNCEVEPIPFTEVESLLAELKGGDHE